MASFSTSFSDLWGPAPRAALKGLLIAVVTGPPAAFLLARGEDARTESEFARRQHRIGSIYPSIAREGRELYAAA